MTKDPLKEIGSLIRTARERLGLSIDALALESRVSSKHILNIENANRTELPEDTFLVSYLNKLLRTLKIPNPDELINQYRMKEGDYIVQTIIDVQEINSGEGIRDGKYFKIYHLYILLVLFIFLCTWIVVNKANEDYEYSPVLSSEPVDVKPSNNFFDILSKLNPIKDKEESEEDLEKDTKDSKEKNKKEKDAKVKTEKANGSTLDSNGTALNTLKTEEAPAEDVKSSTITTEVTPSPPATRRHSISRGSGAYNVKIGVKDKAWVQVIGVGSKKVLYEGDVSPDQAISALDLKDDVGFVLATGNAGAFDIDVGSGNFKLGNSGQLVKWFYPESARTIYKSWSKTPVKN
jgi:cytoskeletal protein RodZ